MKKEIEVIKSVGYEAIKAALGKNDILHLLDKPVEELFIVIVVNDCIHLILDKNNEVLEYPFKDRFSVGHMSIKKSYITIPYNHLFNLNDELMKFIDFIGTSDFIVTIKEGIPEVLKCRYDRKLFRVVAADMIKKTKYPVVINY